MKPGRSEAYVDSACKYYSSKSIHPFAFRTHAHSRGKSGPHDGTWWSTLGVHLCVCVCVCLCVSLCVHLDVYVRVCIWMCMFVCV